jgi:hypothetical protein
MCLGTTPINRAPIRNNKKCPQIYIEISKKTYVIFIRQGISETKYVDVEKT